MIYDRFISPDSARQISPVNNYCYVKDTTIRVGVERRFVNISLSGLHVTCVKWDAKNGLCGRVRIRFILIRTYNVNLHGYLLFFGSTGSVAATVIALGVVILGVVIFLVVGAGVVVGGIVGASVVSFTSWVTVWVVTTPSLKSLVVWTEKTYVPGPPSSNVADVTSPPRSWGSAPSSESPSLTTVTKIPETIRSSPLLSFKSHEMVMEVWLYLDGPTTSPPTGWGGPAKKQQSSVVGYLFKICWLVRLFVSPSGCPLIRNSSQNIRSPFTAIQPSYFKALVL